MYLVPIILSIISAYPSYSDDLAYIGNDRAGQFGNALGDDEVGTIGDLNMGVAILLRVNTRYLSGEFHVRVMVSRHVCYGHFEVLPRFLRSLFDWHIGAALLVICTPEQQHPNAQC
jgi:hypothetical protein